MQNQGLNPRTGNPASPQNFGGSATPEGGPADLVEGWLDYLVAVRGRAPATADRYRRAVAALLEDQKVTRWDELTFQALERHMKRLFAAGRAESTRAGTVAALKSFCEYAVASGRVEINPAAELRPPRVYQSERPVLTVGEVKRLIFAEPYPTRDPIALRNRVALAVAYSAGLRASEVGVLRLDQLQFDGDRAMYRILVRRAKWANQDHRITLDRTTSRVLGAYLEVRELVSTEGPWIFPTTQGRPLSRRTIWEAFRNRLAEAKIEPRGRQLTPHTLRHSIATHLIQAGMAPTDVQLHLRHAGLDTTQRYVQTTTNRVAQQVAQHHPLHG